MTSGRKLGIATAALAAALALSALAAPHTASPQGKPPARFSIDMKWKPTARDVNRKDKTYQTDKFETSGKPFGEGRVRTTSPRKYKPNQVVVFEGRHDDGTYKGRIVVTKDYRYTSTTKQIVRYKGYGGELFDGTGDYIRISADDLELSGRTECTATKCEGALYLEGTAEFPAMKANARPD